MITIVSITFLICLCFLLFLVCGKVLKENEELKRNISEYQNKLNVSNKIDINSTGYFKHVYYDEILKIPAVLFIHIKVSDKDLSGNNFKFDFDFKRFQKENNKKNTNVEFDFQTIQYLRLKEHQWHSINSEEVIWSEFKESIDYKEEKFTIDDFKFEEEKQVKTIELTDFEKSDINSFLKFSNISEETKDTIKKILKI